MTADEPPLDSPLLEELPDELDSPLLEVPREELASPLPVELFEEDDSPLLVEPVELEEPDSPLPELEELASPALEPLDVLVVEVLGAAEELLSAALLDLSLEALAFVPELPAVLLRLIEALSAGS